jgi:hypothetical protein
MSGEHSTGRLWIPGMFALALCFGFGILAMGHLPRGLIDAVVSIAWGFSLAYFGAPDPAPNNPYMDAAGTVSLVLVGLFIVGGTVWLTVERRPRLRLRG